MVELRLSWPAKELSPNGRLHWSKVAKVKKSYRTECHYTALPYRDTLPANQKLALEVTFYRPAKRAYDRDNLLARMKSGLDGVADGLGINDRLFDPVIVRVADEVGGYVNIKIYQQHEES